jgi:hypothetical protein
LPPTAFEVLSVRGPVAVAVTQPLLEAVHEALAHESRAVVLDLQEAELSDGVRSALGSLPAASRAAGRWPRWWSGPPTSTPDMTGWLRAGDR